MSIKGLIIASGTHEDKMFDCEVSVPSLKVHLAEGNESQLLESMSKANYTNVMFMVQGGSVEVPLCVINNGFYANARKISELNLDNMAILKENSLVKKYLEKDKKPTAKKKFK